MTIEIMKIRATKENVEITYWNSNTMKKYTKTFYWNMFKFNLELDI